MACSSPLCIINPHYKALAKQYRIRVRCFSSEPDYRIIVPCGHCMDCLKKRQQNWFLRAHKIYKTRHYRPKDCYFCTFTLKPEVYAEAVEKPYLFIRRFIDRLRKHSSLKGRKLKFDYLFVLEFADGETARKRGLPSTNRMHFHAIFFGCPLTCQIVRKCWSEHYGRAQVERLKGEEGVRYVLKYMTKDRKACQGVIDSLNQKKNGKFFCSHGFARLSPEEALRLRKYMAGGCKSFFSYPVNNYLCSIPRYFKNQCFSKEEIDEYHKKYVPDLLARSIKRRFPYESEEHRRLILQLFLTWL